MAFNVATQSCPKWTTFWNMFPKKHCMLAEAWSRICMSVKICYSTCSKTCWAMCHLESTLATDMEFMEYSQVSYTVLEVTIESPFKLGRNTQSSTSISSGQAQSLWGNQSMSWTNTLLSSTKNPAQATYSNPQTVPLNSVSIRQDINIEEDTACIRNLIPLFKEFIISSKNLLVHSVDTACIEFAHGFSLDVSQLQRSPW